MYNIEEGFERGGLVIKLTYAPDGQYNQLQALSKISALAQEYTMRYNNETTHRNQDQSAHVDQHLSTD